MFIQYKNISAFKLEFPIDRQTDVYEKGKMLNFTKGTKTMV